MLISAYPRSGQVYLRAACELMLETPLRDVSHTVKAINEAIETDEQILFAFRNPVDCVSGWSRWLHQNESYEPTDAELESDLAFWIRITSAALSHSSKIVFIDFDKFTTDTTYIASKCKKSLGLKVVNSITDEDVRAHMVTQGTDQTNLPSSKRDSKRSSLKKRVKGLNRYPEAVELYTKLKQLESER